MHLSAVWLLPFGAGAVAAAGLTLLAARLRREVDQLQRSMRPLRTDRRPRRPID